MTPQVDELIERWGISELPASQVLFLTGAGISSPPPTSFPLGNPLHRLLLSSFSSLTPGEVCALLSLNTLTFEQSCDAIFDEFQAWQPNSDVNWFWNLLSEIFIYRPDFTWARPNDFHAYFRKHIELGGRHFTANLDQFIELDSMPYSVLTTRMLESTDVPLNVANMVNEPQLYKFHGDCTVDAVHLQGVLHHVISAGFQANTRQYWSEVLQSVQLVCVCGYGGFDSFDVNRYFEALGPRHFHAKAVWIRYAPNTHLETVPDSDIDTPATSMILSRFSDSAVLKGEPDELLNALFSGSAPHIHRHPPGPHAQQYNDIFQHNIDSARAIPGFNECHDRITQRLRETVHKLYSLTTAEHEEARRIAYGLARARVGGKLPPYDPAAASRDFCEAAGQIIANRACP